MPRGKPDRTFQTPFFVRTPSVFGAENKTSTDAGEEGQVPDETGPIYTYIRVFSLFSLSLQRGEGV